MSTLLSLPRELRDEILLNTILNDLESFSLDTIRPASLFVSHQLQDEYSDILFNSPVLRLEAYHGGTNCWSEVQNRQSKREIFLRCRFEDIMVASFNTPLGVLEFMGSARRGCERLWSEGQGRVETGILTVSTRKGGLRRWQWVLQGNGEGEGSCEV